LFFNVSACQNTARPLDGESDLVEELPYMAGMIPNSKLLLDDVGNDARSPDSAVQAIGDRSALNNVVESTHLCFVQEWGSS
jgi:hypothetical protein